MPAWLKSAVFYEIYPQSFCDTNADGIGDFNGIISKLDYIRDMGFNALWINPCFDSPFKDAGYDVRDYKKAAARYGTNEDLVRLFEEAHARGIRVLLDLVPGHTSEEHEWFRRSKEAARNEYWDRYIWTGYCFQGTGNHGYPYVGGEADRSGTYLLNFFKCQPALNYGWLEADEDWKVSCDSEAAFATREAMKDVMRFWMDQGCDGFRVDMAASLVKGDDEKKTGTSRIWRNIREMMDRDYPDCALVSEWSDPKLSLRCGFHTDFLLNHPGEAYSTLVRDYENHAGRNILSDPYFTGVDHTMPRYEDHSFFKMDSGSDIRRFMDDYMKVYDNTRKCGYISMITCNHDTVRPSFNLTQEELKLFYAFLFTMPGVPFLYYGDEIGMRYLSLPTKEGGYFRTGSRTPMQWNSSKNLGFSEADEAALYLPVDSAWDAPTVEAQQRDPQSLLNTVRSLLHLRAQETDLQADAPLEILYIGRKDLPLVYKRGKRIMAVNPSSEIVYANIGSPDRDALWSVGTGTLKDGTVTVGAQSFVIF